MFPLAFLCSLLVISLSLEGLLGDKGKLNARDLYHTNIAKKCIFVGATSLKSYFDECLRYGHYSRKSIIQCMHHEHHVNRLRRLSKHLKFEGYVHMKRCTRPSRTTIPLSTYSNNHDLSTSSLKHGVTTGAPIRLSESNQNIITSKPAAVNQLTNESPSSDVTLTDRGRQSEITAALLKRVNVKKDFIKGTELGKAFTSIKNPQSAIANAGVMPDKLSKKAKTGDFDGHRNRRGIFPFLCPRSSDRCMDKDRFIDFLKQTDGLGLNAQKLGKRKKIKRLLALQKMLQTTSSLPKQSNAQTTSALPKQSHAQTTSALPKQSNAQTTSSLPKQSNAQTTSALLKQSNEQTTSALPKQSHAQTTIPLSNDTHIDDLDTAELNDIGSSGEPVHLPEANQNIFISEPEYMNPNLTNELPPSALNEELIAGNELETFTNHVENPPLTEKKNAAATASIKRCTA
ncbi:hypothetical protein Btru_015360 [Bulinus truncatus]|nr:hypothetical protein Btru_015360 [Bulinus truncatus]